MNKHLFTGALALGIVPQLMAQQAEMPNIVFILVDDLGYGDLTCVNENGKIKTPHIDSLSEDGVTFVDAHSSSAVSSPSRYGILTGRYNWRSWKKKGALWMHDQPMIQADRTTMASMLRTQGYQTACIGKWHLGMYHPTTDGGFPTDTETEYNLDYTKEIKGGPCDVGFDYYFGVDAPNFPPYCFIENRKTVGIPSHYLKKNFVFDCREGRAIEGWDVENDLPAVTERASRYIGEASKQGKPFFLYLPLTSPHTPIAPTDEFMGSSQLNKYADFVKQTDASVGQVLKALKDNGLEKNTIVVFTSDNGCSPVADYKFLGSKGHDPSYIFRGTKSDLFEGGHHIPCLVKWPAKVKPHTVKQTICLTDFMATFAALSGYKLADNEAEDSYNLMPLLASKKEVAPLRDFTVHHSVDGSFAIRQGKWKLLTINHSGGWSAPSPKNGGKVPFQLYDMEKDPEETVNLYESYPEKAEELRKLLVKCIKDGRSTAGVPQKNDEPKVTNQYENQKEWYQLDKSWFY